MTSLVIALVAINLILLAERYIFWHLLWSRYQERERRADQMYDRLIVMYDRLLSVKGVRPLTEPKAAESGRRAPSLTRDEMDAIQDRIRERLEVATLRNEPITLAQAEAAVWASLGYPQPPNLNGN